MKDGMPRKPRQLEDSLTDDERETLATLRAFAQLARDKYRGYQAKIRRLLGRARKRAERGR